MSDSKKRQTGANRRAFLTSMAGAAALVPLSASGAAASPVEAAPADASSRRKADRRHYYDIEEFGARGDGETNNQAAIQEAIDTCAGQGGGTIYVPPGRFMTGSIRLRSHVHLFLDSGATLFGSPNPEDYDVREPTDHVPGDSWGSALLLAEGEEQVTLSGQGTIEGAGLARPGEQTSFRPRLIALEKSSHLHVEGLTLQDPDRWTLHLYHCDHAIVQGVSIFAKGDVLNTDGIDVDGCTNVVISDCDIAVGDDCVVLKTTDYLGPARPCKNVTVTNCNFSTRASGFKIGTETHADFENITFSNSTMYVNEEGVRPHDGIALETVDGARLQGVSISNIAMRGVEAPIFIRLGNRGRRQEEPEPGVLRDVTISNVVATDASFTSNITGLPGHDVENVSLSDIRIVTRGGGTEEIANRTIEERAADYPKASMFGPLPAHGLFVRHVRGLSLRNVSIRIQEPDARPLLVADDVADFHSDALWPDPDVRADPLIRLKNVRNASLRGTSPPAGVRTWVHLSGASTHQIVLMPNSLEGIERPVNREDEVPRGAVQLKAR